MAVAQHAAALLLECTGVAGSDGLATANAFGFLLKIASVLLAAAADLDGQVAVEPLASPCLAMMLARPALGNTCSDGE